MKTFLMPSLLSISLLTSANAQSTTFVLGDGLAPNGSAVVTGLTDGVAPGGPIGISIDTGRESVAASIASGTNTVQISTITDSSGSLIGDGAITSTSNSNNINGFNPIVVGGTNGFRTVSTFDLSAITIPAGQQITSVNLYLEVSEFSLNAGTISFHEGAFAGGTTLDSNALLSSRDFSTDPVVVGNFFEFDLSDASISPTDTAFTFTISSDNGEQFLFGSDVGADGTVTGTRFANVAPILVLTTEAIPEPSTGLLLAASTLFMCGRRRRKNA